jgi:outer membrane usher protein
MPWSRCSRRARAALIGMKLVAGAGLTLAQAASVGEPLYLEVFINGQPTGLIANFVQRPAQRLAITVTELTELRIRSDRLPVDRDGLVDLDRYKGLSYQYDEVTQTIRLEISDQSRVPFVVKTQDRPAVKPTDTDTMGAVVNYTLFGSSNVSPRELVAAWQTQSNISAGFDARAFGPFGVFSQSGLVNSAIEAASRSVRLESTWSYSDSDSMVTYRAGDVISGGLSWTRSVRLGGVQVQRNFGLRPDLVTLPMPQYSGSAALPSTVDVFVNNVRGYSGSVPAGPYQIQNLPIMTGAGNQSIVVQDALGRQTVVNQPYYSSSKLLAAGLLDYSVESGFTRREYGVSSNAYDKSASASASLRYGLNDWLTLEGHAEGSNSLGNAGAGVNMLLASWGVMSVAVAASRGDSAATGGLFAASLELGRGGYTFYARTQRTTTSYLDLASLPPTASLVPGIALLPSRPARAIDQVAMSIPLSFDASSVTVSMTRLVDAVNNRNDILAMSYSRPLPYNASMFVTAFKDFDDKRSFGVFAGLTMSFSGGITAASTLSKTGSGLAGGLEVIKAQPLETDSWGWRIRDSEGATPSRSAAVSYRSSVGRAEVGAQQFNGATRATAQMDGAVAFVGGGTFFSNRIDDAFAVVDAGAPDVDVFYENRPVATTGKNGMVLLPYLRAYQNNSISIDARNLAADADVPRTKAIVTPSDRGAALVRFGIAQAAQNALVVVKGADGKPIPVGSRARIADGGEEEITGYGGELYLRGLKQKNVLLVERDGGQPCRADFDYRPTPGTRVVINDVVCR